MDRRGFAFLIAFLFFGCGLASAQTTFNGGITPGVTKRADVDKALGAPVKQDNSSTFEYKPPSGASGLQVAYRPDGVVSAISVTFAQAFSRTGMILALDLSAETPANNVSQGRLREYFGAPAYVALTYASDQMLSGVVNLHYDSPQAYVAEAPSGGPQSSATNANSVNPGKPVLPSFVQPPPNTATGPSSTPPKPNLPSFVQPNNAANAPANSPPKPNLPSFVQPPPANNVTGPKPPSNVRDAAPTALAGNWMSIQRPGSPAKPASIAQVGNTLAFTNEFGGKSRGYFLSANMVVAQDWEGGLHATLSPDGRQLNWANGSVWYRAGGTPPR